MYRFSSQLLTHSLTHEKVKRTGDLEKKGSTKLEGNLQANNKLEEGLVGEEKVVCTTKAYLLVPCFLLFL